MSEQDTTIWVSVDWAKPDGQIVNLRGVVTREHFNAIVTETEDARWVRLQKVYWVNESTDEKTGETTISAVRYGRDGPWRNHLGDLYIPGWQIVSVATLDGKREREFLEREALRDELAKGWPA